MYLGLIKLMQKEIKGLFKYNMSLEKKCKMLYEMVQIDHELINRLTSRIEELEKHIKTES